MDREAFIHFVGGAVGGTAGTAITCPLEVIKTRLQSSKHGFDDSGGATTTTKPSTSQSGSSRSNHTRKGIHNFSSRPPCFQVQLAGYNGNVSTKLFQDLRTVQSKLFHTSFSREAVWKQRGVGKYIFDIVKKEGFSSLYKGLLPNLVGVAPSKAVYFYTYSSSKRFCNQLDFFVPNTAIVHMVSAGFAGFITATVINPVWLVKTRLQLHHGPLTIRECILRIFKREGVKGFYKGVTASYMGISETIIQFVLYEHLRAWIDDYYSGDESKKFFNFMLAGGCAKFIACIMAYPHEVVRTRLREEESKAKGFFRTLKNLYGERGFRSLYRGLSIQLLRSVPNTAITMGSYELTVACLHSFLNYK